MQDIAQLGFSIDSSQATQATSALDRMAVAATAAGVGTAALTDRHKQYVQALEQTVARQNSLIEGLNRSGVSAQALQQRLPELSQSFTAFDRVIQTAADAVDNRITSSLRKAREEVRLVENSFKGVDLASWTERSAQGFSALYNEASRFYQLTGQAPQQMLRFQYVTERIGLDARETAKAIERLSQAMQGVSRDGMQIREVLSRYGVTPQQDAAQTAVAFSDAVLRARPSQQRTRDTMQVFGTTDPEVVGRIAGFSAVRRAEDQVERGNRIRREADELESIRLRSMANQIRTQTEDRSAEVRAARAPTLVDDIFSREGGPMSKLLRLVDRLDGTNAAVGGQMDLISAQANQRRAMANDNYNASGGYFGRVGRNLGGGLINRVADEVSITAFEQINRFRAAVTGTYQAPPSFTPEQVPGEYTRRVDNYVRQRDAYEREQPNINDPEFYDGAIGALPDPLAVNRRMRNMTGPVSPDVRDILVQPGASPLDDTARAELFGVLSSMGITRPGRTLGAQQFGRTVVGGILGMSSTNTTTDGADTVALREIATAMGRSTAEIKTALLALVGRAEFAASDPSEFALSETRFSNTVNNLPMQDRALERRVRAYASENYGDPRYRIDQRERDNLYEGLVAENDNLISGAQDRASELRATESVIREAYKEGAAAAEDARIKQEALNEARRRGMTDTQAAAVQEVALFEARQRRLTQNTNAASETSYQNDVIGRQTAAIAAASRTTDGLAQAQIGAQLTAEADARRRQSNRISTTAEIAAEQLPAEQLGVQRAVAAAETQNAQNQELLRASRSADLNALREVQAQMRANEQTARAYALAVASGNQSAVDKVKELREALVAADLAAQKTAETLRTSMAAGAARISAETTGLVATLGPTERAIAQQALGNLPESVNRLSDPAERESARRAWIAGRGFRSADGQTEFSAEDAGAIRGAANANLRLSLVGVGEQIGAQDAAMQNALRIMQSGGAMFDARMALSASNSGIAGGVMNAAMQRQMVGQARMAAFQDLSQQRDALASSRAIGGVATGTSLEQAIAQLQVALTIAIREAKTPGTTDQVRESFGLQRQNLFQQSINGRNAQLFSMRESLDDQQAELALGPFASDSSIAAAVGRRRLSREFERSSREAALIRRTATSPQERGQADELEASAREAMALGNRGIDMSEQITQMRDYREAARSAVSVLSDGFRAATLEGRKLGDVVKYVQGSLGAITMRALIEKPAERMLMGMFGGSGGGASAGVLPTIGGMFSSGGIQFASGGGTVVTSGAGYTEAAGSAQAPSGGGFMGAISGLGSMFGAGQALFGGGASASGGIMAGINSWGASTGLFSSAAPTMTSTGMLVGGGAQSTGAVATTGALGGGATLGATLGGIGAGFMVGSTVGGMIAGDSKARNTNANIGAGVGAVVGSFWGPVGSMVGGAIGGAAGGMIGPGKGFSGGDALLQIDENGQVQVSGYAGKNFNQPAQLLAEAQRQATELNQRLVASGLRFRESSGKDGQAGRLGGGQSPWSTNIVDGLAMGGNNGLDIISDNANVTRAITGKTDLNEIFNITAWVKDTYENLDVAAGGLEKFNKGLQDMLKPIDQAIGTAKAYGLEIDGLEKTRARAMKDAQDSQRDTGKRQSDNLVARAYSASGTAEDRIRASEMALQESAFTGRRDMPKFLADVGLSDDSFWVETLNRQLEEAIAAEQEAINRARASLANQRQSAQVGVANRYQASTANLSGRADQQLASTMSAFDEQAKQEVISMRETFRQLGLTAEQTNASIHLLVSAHEAERASIQKAYDERKKLVSDNLEDRLFATTNDNSTLAEMLATIDRRMNKERIEAAKDGLTDMVQLEKVMVAERNKVIADELKATGGNIRSYVDSLRATPRGGGSYQEQFAAAQEQFGRDLTLARGGDRDALSRITQSSDNLLAAGRGMYASGLEFTALKEFVASSLENLTPTKTYDQLILEELQKLGGVVDVNVDLSVVRVVTEALNALPTEERNKLLQTQTILRTVEEKLGRLLTPSEQNNLIQGAVVSRSIEQMLGRDLTPAERAALLDSDEIDRMIRQTLAQDLTPQERAKLIESNAIIRSIEQTLGRDLTQAEKASIVESSAVVRSITQALGRDLTVAERAAILQSDQVDRMIRQTLDVDLTQAERERLVEADSIVRSIEQQIGRELTTAEKASLIQTAKIDRNISQAIGRTLTATEKAALLETSIIDRDISQTLARELTQAERNRLVQSQEIIRTIEQQMGRDLTTSEKQALIQAATIERIVVQQLGRNLTADERAGLVNAASVIRSIEQSLGRDLTVEERAKIFLPQNVVRVISQTLGSDLTPAQREALLAPANIRRVIEQVLTVDLTQAQRERLLKSEEIFRTIEQRIGRNLTAAETASLVESEIIERTVTQGIGRNLTVAERASLVNGETVLRAIEQTIGRNLSDAEKSSLVMSETVVRTLEQEMGKTLTAAEKASLYQTATVLRTIEQEIGVNLTKADRESLISSERIIRSVEQRLGVNLNAAQRQSLINSATVVRNVEQKIGRNLTESERSALVNSDTVLLTIKEELGYTLTATEKAALLQSEDITRTVKQMLGSDLTAAEKASLYQAATIMRTIEQEIGANLTKEDRDSLISSARVVRQVEQRLGVNLNAAQRQSLINSSTVVRNVEQKIGRNLTESEISSLINSDTILLSIEEELGRTLTAAERAALVESEAVIRTVQQTMGADLTAAQRSALLSSSVVNRVVRQWLDRDLTDAERDGLYETGNIVRTIEQKLGVKLTEAEKAAIVMPGGVLREVMQKVLSPTGVPLVKPDTVTKTIEQLIKEATGAKLLTADTIVKTISVDFSYAVQQQFSYLHNLADIRNYLFDLRELARGAEGGLRVTTLQASNTVNSDGFRDGQGANLNPIGGFGSNWGGITRNARGNAFMGGNVIPFARGGVFDEPTLFPMADGQLGLTAEVGKSEGLFPLERMANGDLGVKASISVSKSDGGGGELVQAVNALKASVDALRAQSGRDGRRTADATERTAAATEAMNSSKGGIRPRVPVGERSVA